MQYEPRSDQAVTGRTLPAVDELPASVLPAAESTLLPRYSFRTLMIVITLLAVVGVIVRQAAADAVWAQAIVFAVSVMLACWTLFVVLFLLAWLPAQFGHDSSADVSSGSPFATDQLPAQLLPPGKTPS